MQREAVLLFYHDFSKDFYGFHHVEHMYLSWWDDPTYILITQEHSEVDIVRRLARIHPSNIILRDPFAQYPGAQIKLDKQAITVDNVPVREVKYTIVRIYINIWQLKMTHNHNYHTLLPNEYKIIFESFVIA